MNIRNATNDDLDWIVKLANSHKRELGFVRTVSLKEAIQNERLIVIDGGGGFCEFYPRKDGWTSVYAIVSTIKGGGRALVESLKRPIRLSCPEDLYANGFYAHIGGERIGVFDGKKRRLVEWHWSI